MVLNMAYTTQPYLRHYVKVWLATTIQKRDNKKQKKTIVHECVKRVVGTR